MIPQTLLAELGWVLAAAAIAALATRPLRLPPVLAYMGAGLVLGPATGFLHASASLDVLGELGIAFLLFLVGLELSPAALRDVGRSSVIVGGSQVALTAALGAGGALLLGVPFPAAALLGLGVAFSSTVVVVKLLDRTGQLSEEHGRLSVGILLVQDVAVALALAVVAGLGGQSGDGSLALDMLRAFLGLGLLAVVAGVSARWLLPRAATWMAGHSDGLLIASLTWCFGFIVLAETLQLSIELGAFLAGLSLAPTRVHGELRRRVQPLADLFLAVFFVVLGAELEPAAALEQPAVLALLVVLVLVAKPLVLAGLARAVGRPARTAVLTGTTLGQMSEFSFILGAAAVSAGLIEEASIASLGVAGLATIAVSAVVVQVQRQLWGRFGPTDETDGGSEDAGRHGHVVVVGMNTLGRRLVDALLARGEQVVAIDVDPTKLDDLEAEVLQGSVDHWAVLDEAGVTRAKLVISALQIEDANTLLAHRCKQLGIPVSVHAFDASVRADLERIGVDHIMDSKREGARRLRDALAELEILDPGG